MNAFENPAFFLQLFQGIPEAVAILDSEDRVVVVNDAFEKFFGFSRDRIRGSKINDLVVPEEYLEEGLRNSRMVLDGTPLVDSTAVRRRADGTRVHVSITARPIYLEGRQAAIVALYRDISDQVILLDSIDTHIWYLKEPEKYGAVNEAHATFYGLAKEDMQNRRMAEFFGSTMAAPLVESNREVFRNAMPTTVERWTRRADGDTRLLRITKKPRFDTQGQIVYVVCTAEDITVARQQENRLRLLSTMVEQAADPMVHLDVNYRISYMNPAAEQHYGWTLEELRGSDPIIFNAEENKDQIQEEIRATTGGGRVYEGRLRNRRKDGSVYMAQIRIAPIIDDDGAIIGFVDSKRDITAEQQELEAKELLLREVQHRVKNNLATVVSLLTLQSAGMEDPVAVEALHDARRRIEAMLTVYEALQLTSDCGEINLTEYLQDLIHRLEATLHSHHSIRFTTGDEPAFLESSAAISVGMIVNELLTNAVKHAFPGDHFPEYDDSSRITVELLQQEAGVDGYTITVADNGISMPDTGTDTSGGSLGLTLVHSLVDKLQGEIRIERGGGTRIIVRFPRTT